MNSIQQLKNQMEKRNREDEVQKCGKNRPVMRKCKLSEAEIQPETMFCKFKPNTILTSKIHALFLLLTKVEP